MTATAARALPLAAGAFAAASTGWLVAGAFASAPLPVAVATGAAALCTALVALVRHLSTGRLAPAAATLTAAAASTAGLLAMAALLTGEISPLAALDALASCWARYLSATVPVSTSGELLLVPAVHAWAAGSALALLQPTRRPVGWSVAVIVGAAGAAMLLVAPAAPALVPLLAVVAAALGLALVHGHGQDGHAVAVRHGLPVIAGALLAASAVAVLPQPRQRQTLRDPDTVPVEEVRGVSPLAEIKAALVAQPVRTQLLVSTAPTDGLVRRATLERYDGMSWTVEGRFHRTGDHLAAPAASADAVAGVSTTITVADSLDRWVPAPGQPRTIDGTAFRWNTRSGDLLADRPLESGTVLHVTGAPVPHAETIGPLAPASDAELLALTRTDGASEGLLAQLDALLGGGAPGERLARAQRELSQRFAYSTNAPAGHQDGMLRYILQTSRLGTPEQFAAIGALAARRAGFPARVVVGWKLAADTTDVPDVNAKVDRAIPVRTTDVYAWVEIATTDGWRSVDVTPPRSQTEPEAPQDSTGTGSSADATPEPADEQGDATILSPGTDTGDGATLLEQATRAGIRFGLPALLVAVLASIALLKLQRRRLRVSAAHPADRVLGAWDELIDRLIETGRPPDPAATPSELARHLAEQVPDAAPAVGELAPLVDRAIHAPGLVADEAATDAWTHSRAASTALIRDHRDLRHPYRPITRPFDPRPLVRNRVHRS